MLKFTILLLRAGSSNIRALGKKIDEGFYYIKMTINFFL